MVQTVFNGNVPGGPGATQNITVDTRRMNRITVFWELLGTVTVGDLTNNNVLPFDDTGAVLPQVMPVMFAVASAATSGNVVASKIIDVSGLEKVRVTIQNSNVGDLSGKVIIAAAYEGRG
jgi:hypothetical protein